MEHSTTQNRNSRAKASLKRPPCDYELTEPNRRPLKYTPQQHEKRRLQYATDATITYPNNEKYCMRCAKLRKLYEFAFRKKASDGVTSYCRYCESKRTRLYYDTVKKNDDGTTTEKQREFARKQKLRTRDLPRQLERTTLYNRIQYALRYLHNVRKLHYYEIAGILGTTARTIHVWSKREPKDLRQTLITANNRFTIYCAAEDNLINKGISPIPDIVCTYANVMQTRARAYAHDTDTSTAYDFSYDLDYARELLHQKNLQRMVDGIKNA